LNYARPEDKRCVNCHSNEEIWAFNHSSKKPTHASYSREWLMYYESAWWYQKQWDYKPDVAEERDQNEEQDSDGQ